MSEDPNPDNRDRRNLVVAAIVAVILIVGGFAMYLLKQNLDLQKCELERRMDCNAIAVPNSDSQAPPT